MTGEVEEQLRQLVQRFGVEKVRDALVPLIAECKFSDWQCVAAAVDRISRQQKRSHTRNQESSRSSQRKALM